MTALCEMLNIPRSTFYYSKQTKVVDTLAENAVIEAFKASRGIYGTRKIKAALAKQDIVLSRRRIGRIMRKYGLVSKYTEKHYKVHTTTCNEAPVKNELNRDFDGRAPYEVIVSDLTYVRVKSSWHYICILVDVFNREIIGYSAGPHKNADLVYRAFAKAKCLLTDIQLFHTDRGSEFKNEMIEGLLKAFNIQRSLSHKGCPYDNAVAEATFKSIKVEFVYDRVFESLEELQLELSDYIHWFNTQRFHSALSYMTPKEYRLNMTP